MSEWQPIETYKEDPENTVLIARPFLLGNKIFGFHVIVEGKREGGLWYYMDISSARFVPVINRSEYPTYWMPLPDLPEQENKK